MFTQASRAWKLRYWRSPPWLPYCWRWVWSGADAATDCARREDVHQPRVDSEPPQMMFRRLVTSYRMRRSAVCFALGMVFAGSPHNLLAAPEQAIPTSAFLNSIGIVSTFPDRGQPLDRTIEMIRYGGFRWVRAGIEGLSDEGPTTVQTFLDLHRQTGVLLSWGLVSGGTDVDRLI